MPACVRASSDMMRLCARGVDNDFKSLAGRLAAVFAGGLVAMLITSSAHAEYAFNMTEGVTPSAGKLYGLHMLVFWICVGIGIWFSARWPGRSCITANRRVPRQANFHESTTVEIVWTVVPLLILIAIAIPATGTLLELEDAKTDADMTVQVTGIQWKWKYTYLDDDISFVSNLAQSSRDVIEDPTGQRKLPARSRQADGAADQQENPFPVPLR